VKAGETVFEIHHNAKGLAAATARLNSCVAIADDPSPPPVAYY
jgi:hypothetical protein